MFVDAELGGIGAVTNGLLLWTHVGLIAIAFNSGFCWLGGDGTESHRTLLCSVWLVTGWNPVLLGAGNLWGFGDDWHGGARVGIQKFQHRLELGWP